MKRILRKLVRFFTIIIAGLVLLCIVGEFWNYLAVNLEQAKNPPLGEMVKPFDSKIHVFSTGVKKENEPTIVLISGLMTPSPVVDFNPIWSRLEKNHSVVVLDRPGYGWSESTKRDRTVQNIMDEDRQALLLAGFTPPYILAAHSMGGLEAAMYANSYPDEIAGVVLLDSMAPDITLAAGPHTHGLIRDSISKLNTMMRPTGVLRLIATFSPDYFKNASQGNCNNFSMVDPSLKDLYKAHVLQNYMNRMTLKESDLLLSNAETIKKLGFPSSIPLESILSSAQQQRSGYAEQLEMQKAWVSQSAVGNLYILEGEHNIHHYDPDGVCQIIEDLIDNIR